jgi:hypothetical protein
MSNTKEGFMDNDNSWKTKTMIIGGVIGALLGVAAAYMIVKRSEMEGERPQLSTGEGVRLGLGVLGLMRMLADTGEK